MKVVVLGGSSQSTPALWSYLTTHAEGLRVVLMGRHAGRLQAVLRACRMLSESSSNTIEWRRLDDPEAWNGLDDTRAFVVQVRNGGYAARDLDETLPLAYGVCGDEGLGPGGLSAGIRNWRSIEPLLKRISRTAPDAQVLLVSSPVGLLVRAAARMFPQLRVIGICELPWTTLLDIAAASGVPAEAIQFDYLGVNHLGWFYRLEHDGEDVVQKYARLRSLVTGFPSAALIRQCGAVPLAYLRLHYEREATLESQRQNARSRGAVLSEWSEQAFRVYAAGTREDIEHALRRRRSPWYPYAIGPFLAFLAGHAPRLPFFLSVTDCTEPDFKPDDVLECAHVAESGRLRRLPRRAPVPSHLKQLLMRFVEYERLAARAVLTAGLPDIGTALEAHPWTQGLVGKMELAERIYESAGATSPLPSLRMLQNCRIADCSGAL
jgi:6-phospho-beta-glucosidase